MLFGKKKQDYKSFLLDLSMRSLGSIDALNDALVWRETDIKSRGDADECVKRNYESILDTMNRTADMWEDICYKTREEDRRFRDSISDEEAEKCREQRFVLMEYIQKAYNHYFTIEDSEFTKAYRYYYNREEIYMLSGKVKSNMIPTKFTWPKGLPERLQDDYIGQFMPNEEVRTRCYDTPPKVIPRQVLEGICLGDYLGQPYEALLPYDEYDEKNPYDVHVNSFTDDSTMALAIYEVCERIKDLELSTPKEFDVIPEAYNMFIMSMKYYANMLPTIGYGPRFYNWAVKGGENYDSYANGGAMRSGAIGVFFDKIEDVIRYTIISTFATHSHPIGEKGAVMTAVCVWMANHGATKDEIKEYVSSMSSGVVNLNELRAMAKPVDEDKDIIFDLSLTPDDLGKLSADGYNTYTLSGVKTVSQAIINFLDSKDVLSCLSNAMKYKCDADTVAAISGGIASAYYGEVPFMKQILEARNDEKVQSMTRFLMKHIVELD